MSTMKKDCRNLDLNKCKVFAAELTQLKVKAGQVGLFETMQVLDKAVQKVGWEIAQNMRPKKNPHAKHLLRLSCDYDEGKQSTYRAFVVSRKGKERDVEVKRFSTGDPVKDWADMCSYIVENPPIHCAMTSSIDHFVMDGKKYEWDENENIIHAKPKKKVPRGRK